MRCDWLAVNAPRFSTSCVSTRESHSPTLTHWRCCDQLFMTVTKNSSADGCEQSPTSVRTLPLGPGSRLLPLCARYMNNIDTLHDINQGERHVATSGPHSSVRCRRAVDAAPTRRG